MTYSVKEIFYTLQGEGANAGRPAVFCRFAGCNLWSGKEAHRGRAICQFCDTDFVGTDGTRGGKYQTAAALSAVLWEHWPQHVQSRPFVVCTGGEPLLQLDDPLIDALHGYGFEIAVETNGTVDPPAGIDWVCVSPKARAPLAVTSGHELKLVFPQIGTSPDDYVGLAFCHFFLQPMDGPRRDENTQAAIAYCLEHPQWRLSVQTHKYVGIR